MLTAHLLLLVWLVSAELDSCHAFFQHRGVSAMTLAIAGQSSETTTVHDSFRSNYMTDFLRSNPPVIPALKKSLREPLLWESATLEY